MTTVERRLYRIGQQLARRFPEWELVVTPLPQAMLDDLTTPQRYLVDCQAGADWFRFVLDGWEEVRGAARPGT